MRLRNSAAVLKRLQHLLRSTRRNPDDAYSKAILANFWDRLRVDKRIARGELN